MDPIQNENNEILQQIELLLDSLTRSELIMMNKSIVNRIREMDEQRLTVAISKFHKGQKVQWDDRQGWPRYGTVLRVNTKSISVLEDDDPDVIWKIGPSHLTIVNI